MSECDFERETGGWSCQGAGNLLGEQSCGHGATRRAAYDAYLATRRTELAGTIEDDADEAELVQREIQAAGENPDTYGTSLRDGLLAAADTDALRERARRLREQY